MKNYIFLLFLLSFFACKNTNNTLEEVEADFIEEATSIQDELNNITEVPEDKEQNIPIDITKLDAELDSCLAIDDNQSTMGMVQCTYESSQQWDVGLNFWYQKALEEFEEGGEEQKALREAQRKWMKFRDSEQQFMGHLYHSLEGTIYKIFAASRGLEIVKERTFELASYHKMFTQHGSPFHSIKKESNTPIDKTLADCSEQDGDNTEGAIKCYDDAYKKWDNVLNENYKKLMSELSEDNKNLLRTAQRDWIALKESHETFYWTIYKIQKGSLYRQSAVAESYKFTRNRALELEEYLSEL